MLTISYSLNTAFHTIYFFLVILSLLIPVQSICNPTNVNDETPIDQLFCNPKGGEEYEIGQDVILSWNPYNANLFDSNGQVEVYLFRLRQNATGYEEVVPLDPGNSTDFLLVPRLSNSMNITVEPRWLPGYKYSIPVNKHPFVFRVIPSGTNNRLNREFSTPTFMVIQPDSSKPTTETVQNAKVPHSTELPPAVTAGTSIEPPAENNQSENKVLIVVIAVASLAAFLAFIAVVIAIYGRKRSKNLPIHKSQSNLSTSSSTPMVSPISIEKLGNNHRDFESPVEAESIHSTTPLANKEEMRPKSRSAVSFSNEKQPISASDAALLTDAFRKGLRSQDWKPEDEDDADIGLSNEERLRREAKELMKKELAEEGTDLQDISRMHAKVEIHNISGELEGDGSSLLSESGSKE